MICIAISDKNFDNALKQAQEAELAEIRLDLTNFSEDQVKKIFSVDTPLVATCRPDNISDADRMAILKIAIESGARYVDIEIESAKAFTKEMVEFAHYNKCEVIISYHNYQETPTQKELDDIIDECFNLGADVAKVATMVNKNSDNARIFALLGTGRRIVAIGMGEIGKITRIVTPFLGAEFTFASPDSDGGTAPGQVSATAMNNILEELKKL